MLFDAIVLIKRFKMETKRTIDINYNSSAGSLASRKEFSPISNSAQIRPGGYANQDIRHPFYDRQNNWQSLNRGNPDIYLHKPKFDSFKRDVLNNQQVNSLHAPFPPQESSIGQSRFMETPNYNYKIKLPNNKLRLLVLIATLIVFALSGTTYYRGYQISEYAKFVKITWDKKNEEMKIERFVFLIGTDQLDQAGHNMQVASQEAVIEILNKKPPTQAREVQENLIEYFETTNSLGSQMKIYGLISKEYHDINESLTKLPPLSNDTNIEKNIIMLSEIRNKIEATRNNLEQIYVPAHMNNTRNLNEKFINQLTNIDLIIKKAIQNQEEKNISGTNLAIDDYNLAIKELSKTLKEHEEIGSNMAQEFNQKNKRIKELEKNINGFLKKY
jgi:hypothetical protein